MEESLIWDKGFPGRLRMGVYPLFFSSLDIIESATFSDKKSQLSE